MKVQADCWDHFCRERTFACFIKAVLLLSDAQCISDLFLSDVFILASVSDSFIECHHLHLKNIFVYIHSDVLTLHLFGCKMMVKSASFLREGEGWPDKTGGKDYEWKRYDMQRL